MSADLADLHTINHESMGPEIIAVADGSPPGSPPQEPRTEETRRPRDSGAGGSGDGTGRRLSWQDGREFESATGSTNAAVHIYM